MNTIRSLLALCFAAALAGSVASAAHHENKKADEPAKACCGTEACADKACGDKSADKKAGKCDDKSACGDKACGDAGKGEAAKK